VKRFTVVKFWVLVVVCFALPWTLLAAEVLTNDGQKFEGKIIEEADDFIRMEIENGVQVRIDRSQIVFVQKDDETNRRKAEYPLLGVTFGDPAVGNLVAGYFWKDLGVKVSGGFTGVSWGAQLNLCKTLVEDNPPFSHSFVNFSLVGGLAGTSGTSSGSRWDNRPNAGSWLYGGVGLDLNISGFYGELDFVGGSFANSPTFPFQIGYIYRFN
jgi:hypothetical protein